MAKFSFREYSIIAISLIFCVMLIYVMIKQIYTTYLHAEMSNIDKIALAVNVHYTNTNRIALNNANDIVSELLEMQYIDEKDLYSDSTKMFWNFTYCEKQRNGSLYIVTDNVSDNTGLCLYLDKNVHNIPEDYINNSTPATFACYIETLLDDSSFMGGSGRGNITIKNSEYTDNKWDCNIEDKSITGEYLYKVF